MTLFPFPDRPRLFGVAVSHYQVEGDDPCDWTEWEKAGRTRGGPCGRAVDSWRLYEDDLALAKGLEANAFRFSVSWSRVEPRRGVFDQAALSRYRRVVERAAALGIEPIVTLFHYTHPVWFHDETPWTSPRSVDAFARFAKVVAEALGPVVRLYTIFNEPLVFWLGGFLDGQIPPGISDAASARRALDHLLAAHAAAAAVIREEQPRAAISVAHNLMSFAPARGRNPMDRLLARLADGLYNRALPEAFRTGRWSFLLPPATWVRGRRDDLVGSLDVFGVNFYSRLHLRFPGRERLLRGPSAPARDLGSGSARSSRFVGDYAYEDRTGNGLTDNGWEIVPDVFESLLVDAASVGLPLLVTENGLADALDARRASYMEQHVAALVRANARGAGIAGYLHWSLLDNYEWLDGYAPKFGLHGVDRETMTRHERPSAQVFRRLAREFLSPI